LLAKEKGYFFIGCNKAGNNAYFIHESLRQYCPVREKTAEEGYRFAHFSESWDASREPRRGKDKVLSLSGLTVTNILKNVSEIINTDAIVTELLKAGKFNGIHF
jgi:hypothetical protein